MLQPNTKKMKRLFLIATFLFLATTALWSQSVLTLSGTVYFAGTSVGLPWQYVEVNVFDSSSTTLVTLQLVTDSAGNYNCSVANVAFPNGANGEVHVFDCNNVQQSLHFAVSPGSNVYSGFDFYICAGSGACSAAYYYGNANNSTLVNFTDASVASVGSIVSWTWDFGDSTGDTVSNPSHSYAAMGSYNVCLDIVTNLGCTAHICAGVQVGAGPGACTASLSYGTLLTGALGFTASGTGAATPVEYFYDFGDGNTLHTSSSEYPYAYLNGGSFSPCVTILYADSCSATACTSVIGTGGNCQADFYAVPDTTGQFSLLLIDNSFGNNLQYSWDFGDGGSSNLHYPQHTFPGPGTYYICLTVVDSPATCTANFCDSITVINKLNTPFTINVVPSLATAVVPAAYSIQGHAFYPNPAHERITLSLSIVATSEVNVAFFNLQGQIVQSNRLGRLAAGAHQQLLDVSDLPEGMYLARVTVGDKVETRKLAVTH